MSKLAFVAAIAALGLAGYVAWTATDRQAKIENLEQMVSDQTASIEGLSAKLDALGAGGSAPAALMAAEGSGGGMNPLPVETGLATRPAPVAKSDAERLAALEKTVADQRETIAKLEGETDSGGRVRSLARSAMRDRFYHSVDSAAKSLDLDERQKSDMEDLAERARRELAALWDTPNDDGETFKEVSKIKMSSAVAGGENVMAIMSNFKKIQEFKQAKVPGTNETFADAEKRIKKNAFGDMRNLMTPKQQKKWDKAHKDPILRTPGGGASFAFTESVVLDEPPMPVPIGK